MLIFITLNVDIHHTIMSTYITQCQHKSHKMSTYITSQCEHINHSLCWSNKSMCAPKLGIKALIPLKNTEDEGCLLEE